LLMSFFSFLLLLPPLLTLFPSTTLFRSGLLILFGLFAYTGMRIARRSADPFLRLLTATTTMWVLGQAFINIGYVIGILPVTGIQDRKSTRLNSSHVAISYAVFCLKKKII